MDLLEFANPIGWWWATLAIPILLLYILKIRLRRQPVSTLLFWDQLFDEKKPRAWWQRLRHLLSLLLQLAFLLLLVAALTDPLWSWQKNRQRRIVLVVDNSASMQAREDDGQSRLEKAKRSAGALVRSLRSGDRMAVLSAGGKPRVVIGMTDHQRSLLAAIDALPATDGPTGVMSAVTAAERLLADHEQQGEIIVLSDGCFEELAKLQSNEKVTVYGVGTSHDNVAITRYQVRRSLLDAIGYQVLIDVTNFSASDRSCRVELNLAGELVDVIPLELAPGATDTRILDHTSAGGGLLTATLDVNDALSTDNVAIAVLPKRVPIPVILVTKGNLFLKSVLESIPLVELQIVVEPPSAVPAGGILVLDRIVPQQLPSGRVVVVDPQDSCDAWTLGEAIPNPIVAAVDADSALTKHVRLDNVLFPDARLLNFTAEAEPLIRDPLDQPLLARLRRTGGDAIVLTCSLEKGDLPLRIAFPVLMQNAVEWFQGHSGELRPAVASGGMTSIDVATSPADKGAGATSAEKLPDTAADVVVVEQAVAEGKREWILTGPSRRPVPIAASNEQVTIGPLLETGLWTVRPAPDEGEAVPETTASDATAAADSDDDSGIFRVACNLVDAAESDLRPRGQLAGIESVRLFALGGRSLWFYLTIMAAGLIATEWWLYQRRIVG